MKDRHKDVIESSTYNSTLLHRTFGANVSRQAKECSFRFHHCSNSHSTCYCCSFHCYVRRIAGRYLPPNWTRSNFQFVAATNCWDGLPNSGATDSWHQQLKWHRGPTRTCLDHHPDYCWRNFHPNQILVNHRQRYFLISKRLVHTLPFGGWKVEKSR